MRPVPYRARPSLGFLLGVMIVLGVGSFIAWGIQTPDLDVIWRLSHELKLGRRPPLTHREREILQAGLIRFPALANELRHGSSALISRNEDGWVTTSYAYLIRESPAALARVEVTPGAAQGSIRICANLGQASQCAQATPGRPFSWTPPASEPYPQLIELRIGKSEGESRAAHVEVKGHSNTARRGDPAASIRRNSLCVGRVAHLRPWTAG